MKYQDKRNTEGELEMLCFVSEGVHAQQGTDAAAQYGRHNQRRFRDAPSIFSGFLLVDEHKQKGSCIDYSKIDEQIFHVIFLSGGCEDEKSMDNFIDYAYDDRLWLY